MHSEVTSDLFNIAARLKSINKDYRVFWNNRDNRFEIHTHSLEFTVKELDERVLEHAQRTRKENADAIEQEVNEHNAVIASSAKQSIARVNIALADMMDYAAKTSHSVIFTKNNIKEF